MFTGITAKPSVRDYPDCRDHAGSQQLRQARQGYVGSSTLSTIVQAQMCAVLYLGVSDTPAWVISRANEYARNHGLAPFVSQTGSLCIHGQAMATSRACLIPFQVIYQGRWNAASRDIERDILPMCLTEGMAIAPWGAIGQGRFQRKADIGKSKDGRSSGQQTEEEVKVSGCFIPD